MGKKSKKPNGGLGADTSVKDRLQKKLFSKNGDTTNKVHTYSKSWNFLAKGYVAIN